MEITKTLFNKNHLFIAIFNFSINKFVNIKKSPDLSKHTKFEHFLLLATLEEEAKRKITS